MKWDWAAVHGWFTATDLKHRSKKVTLCNIVFPPLSFVMIKFVVVCVIVNDPAADEVVGRVLDSWRARITGCHVVGHCGRPWGIAPGGWGMGGLG